MNANLVIALTVVCAGAFFGYLIYSLRASRPRRKGASSTRQGD
jgi:hypothetical protein